jgi:hypothetical protein
MSRTVLGPTQPPNQWAIGALSLGLKRPVREADHSPPSSAEVNNAWSYTSTPPIRLHGVVLIYISEWYNITSLWSQYAGSELNLPKLVFSSHHAIHRTHFNFESCMCPVQIRTKAPLFKNVIGLEISHNDGTRKKLFNAKMNITFIGFAKLISSQN